MCAVSPDGTAVALGFEQSHPKLDSNGVITLTYGNGPACQGGNVSAIIKFTCKHGTLV